MAGVPPVRKDQVWDFKDLGIHDDVLLPKGSVIHVMGIPEWFKWWLPINCFAGDTVIIKNLSGGVIFHSVCLVDRCWNDSMELNCDIRGINIIQADGLKPGNISVKAYINSGSSR